MAKGYIMPVRAETLPENALLQRYAQNDKNYTDCFVKEVPGNISLTDFITAFYTTPLFRAERFVLKLAVRRPSTDAQAQAIAAGQAEEFAVWSVEDRSEDQALFCDMASSTRSWFMVEPIDGGTRLYFGSAVTPGTSLFVRALAPLHKIYSRGLLGAAKPQISAQAAH